MCCQVTKSFQTDAAESVKADGGPLPQRTALESGPVEVKENNMRSEALAAKKEMNLRVPLAPYAV